MDKFYHSIDIQRKFDLFSFHKDDIFLQNEHYDEFGYCWLKLNDIITLKQYEQLKYFLLLKNDINFYTKNDSTGKSILQTINFEKFHDNINSKTTKCNIDKKDYFVKLVSKSVYWDEIYGYILMRTSYNVTKLEFIIDLGEEVLLLFLYEELDGNLLYNYFQRGLVDVCVEKALCCFAKYDTHDMCFRYQSKNDILFTNRASRLEEWYENFYLFNYAIIINNESFTNCKSIVSECKSYFKQPTMRKCFLSLGDTHELNICCDLKIFDFQMAGYNSLVSESAVFLWSLIGGHYFMKKFHPWFDNGSGVDKYTYPNDLTYTFDDLNKIINVNFHPSKNTIRVSLLRELIETYKGIKMDAEFNCHLKFFLAMRILTVHNLSEMTLSDTIIAMYYLELIFTRLSINDSLNDLEKLFC